MAGQVVSVTEKYPPSVLRLLEALHEPFSIEDRAEILLRALEDAQIEALQVAALELEKLG